MKRLIVTILMAAFFALPSVADVKHDTFEAMVNENNILLGGDGSGWNGGQQLPPMWFEYQNTGWWNQWFYDDPPDPTRWKELSYGIDGYASVDDTLSIDEWMEYSIAINWTSLDFPESRPGGPPPIPPLTQVEEDLYITRNVIDMGQLLDGESVYLEGTFIIPDYNPEWVSIDVSANSLYSDICRLD
ncbi:MAG: hypothetical protein JW947_03715 [Sedimentisphaerales bacterium]|nr:hypothetical protein [Sedimentisphaerales bacterium]